MNLEIWRLAQFIENSQLLEILGFSLIEGLVIYDAGLDALNLKMISKSGIKSKQILLTELYPTMTLATLEAHQASAGDHLTDSGIPPRVASARGLPIRVLVTMFGSDRSYLTSLVVCEKHYLDRLLEITHGQNIAQSSGEMH